MNQVQSIPNQSQIPKNGQSLGNFSLKSPISRTTIYRSFRGPIGANGYPRPGGQERKQNKQQTTKMAHVWRTFITLFTAPVEDNDSRIMRQQLREKR